MKKEDIEKLRAIIGLSFLTTSIYMSFSDINTAIYFILMAIFIKMRMQKNPE